MRPFVDKGFRPMTSVGQAVPDNGFGWFAVGRCEECLAPSNWCQAELDLLLVGLQIAPILLTSPCDYGGPGWVANRT